MGWLKETVPEDLARMMVGGHFQFFPFGAGDGWTETKVGGGDALPLYNYTIQTVTGNNDSVILSTTAPGLEAGSTLTNPARINWDKKLYFGCQAWREISKASVMSRIQLKDATTIGQLGEKGIGWHWNDLAIIGESYGSARAATAAVTTANTRQSYNLLIVHNPGVGVDFYVNKDLKASNKTAANIPSGEGAATVAVCVSMSNDAAGTANGVEYGVVMPWIWQDD